MLAQGLSSGGLMPRLLMAGVSVGSGGGSQLDVGAGSLAGVVVSVDAGVVALAPQPIKKPKPRIQTLPRTMLIFLSSRSFPRGSAREQPLVHLTPARACTSYLLGCGVKRRYGFTTL